MAVDYDDIYCSRCSYALRGLTAGRCPECGHPFDPADLRTVRQDAGPIRRIVTAGDLPEAEAICHLLNEAGIQARALAEGDSMVGGTDRGYAIWVGRHHMQRAQEVIAGHLEETRRLAQDRSAWECPGCREGIEGQFDVCWNCATDRPDVVPE